MKINNTEIVDTYAEAFGMWSAKVIITAENDYWAEGAARAMTGMATSVIGCKCEAGIDMKLSPEDTPDGRPGYSILVFTMDFASFRLQSMGQKGCIRAELRGPRGIFFMILLLCRFQSHASHRGRGAFF